MGKEDGLVLVGYIISSEGILHTDTWFFPGLTLFRARELLAAKGLQGVVLSCPAGDGHGASYSGGVDLSFRNSNMGFSNQRIPVKQSSSGKGMSERTTSRRKPRVPSNTAMVYFACPMAKHDRARYELVLGPCTDRPGAPEFRRVK